MLNFLISVQITVELSLSLVSTSTYTRALMKSPRTSSTETIPRTQILLPYNPWGTIHTMTVAPKTTQPPSENSELL